MPPQIFVNCNHQCILKSRKRNLKASQRREKCILMHLKFFRTSHPTINSDDFLVFILEIAKAIGKETRTSKLFFLRFSSWKDSGKNRCGIVSAWTRSGNDRTQIRWKSTDKENDNEWKRQKLVCACKSNWRSGFGSLDRAGLSPAWALILCPSFRSFIFSTKTSLSPIVHFLTRRTTHSS